MAGLPTTQSHGSRKQGQSRRSPRVVVYDEDHTQQFVSKLPHIVNWRPTYGTSCTAKAGTSPRHLPAVSAARVPLLDATNKGNLQASHSRDSSATTHSVHCITKKRHLQTADVLLPNVSSVRPQARRVAIGQADRGLLQPSRQSTIHHRILLDERVIKGGAGHSKQAISIWDHTLSQHKRAPAVKLAPLPQAAAKHKVVDAVVYRPRSRISTSSNAWSDSSDGELGCDHVVDATALPYNKVAWRWQAECSLKASGSSSHSSASSPVVQTRPSARGEKATAGDRCVSPSKPAQTLQFKQPRQQATRGAVFPKAARWVDPVLATVSHAGHQPGAVTAAAGAKCSTDAEHQAPGPAGHAAPAMAPTLHLDAAYQVVLPRVRGGWVSSSTARFMEGQPSHKRPSAPSPESGCEGSAAKVQRLETHGVEAARDWVQSRHMPQVCFAPPSAKEELKQRLQDRQAQRTWRQHQLKEIMLARMAAAAAADAADAAAASDDGSSYSCMEEDSFSHPQGSGSDAGHEGTPSLLQLEEQLLDSTHHSSPSSKNSTDTAADTTSAAAADGTALAISTTERMSSSTMLLGTAPVNCDEAVTQAAPSPSIVAAAAPSHAPLARQRGPLSQALAAWPRSSAAVDASAHTTSSWFPNGAQQQQQQQQQEEDLRATAADEAPAYQAGLTVSPRMVRHAGRRQSTSSKLARSAAVIKQLVASYQEQHASSDVLDTSTVISQVEDDGWCSRPSNARQTQRSVSVQPSDRPLLHPSFALVERAVPAPRLAPPRPSTAGPTGIWPRRTRDPGPGSYRHTDIEDMALSLSTMRRAPQVVFGMAPKQPHAPASEGLSAAAIVARLTRDPLSALDATLPRAPAPVLGTSDLGTRVPAAHTSDAAPAGTAEGASDGVEHVDATVVPPQVLHISYHLVEGRVRGAPIMVLPSSGSSTASQECDAMSDASLAAQLAVDPWQLDAAVRLRKPAWEIPHAGGMLTAAGPYRMLERPLQPLYPNWDLLKPRTDVGIPAFAHFLNNHRVPEGGTAQHMAQRSPAVGQYDLEAAWLFLQKHVPQVVMQLAEARWRVSLAAALSQGGDQAVVELSDLMACVRGTRAPAWTFAPLPTHHARLPVAVAGRGFGPMLSWDAALALDKMVLTRRSAGVLDWARLPARLVDDAQLQERRHLAPGCYNVRYGQVEVVAPTRRFSTYLGHDLLSSSSSSNNSDASTNSLPEGAVLQLDVLAARDRLQRRQPQWVDMDNMQGRSDVVGAHVVGAGQPYGAYTSQLDVLAPDADKVLSYRPRPPQVVIEAAESSPAPPVSPEQARRGPGMYDITHGDIGTAARAVLQFDKITGHTEDLSPGQAADPLAGQRLSLDLSRAVQHIRPRARTALLLPLHTHHARPVEGAPELDLYRHALYDASNLDMVRALPPRPLDWSKLAGRTSLDETQQAGHPLDYHVEDVPLHVLAGYKRVQGALDWARLQQRQDKAPGVQLEGDRLSLDVLAGWQVTRKTLAGPVPLSKQLGRHSMTAAGGADGDLTSWLNYNPQFNLVRPRPAHLPLFQQQVGRTAAATDEDAGPMGLDAGVYNPHFTQVWRDTHAGVRWSVGAHAPRFPGLGATDMDEGNMLMLHPQLPQGWHVPMHALPNRQPFGAARARWSDPGVIPDEGNMLLLHTGGDDLARTARPTAVNAPAAVWGHMTAARDDVIVQPNDNIPPRQVFCPPVVQRMDTTLMMNPPHNKALELMQQGGEQHPLVVAARRRERVWARIEARIQHEHPARVTQLQQAAEAHAAAQLVQVQGSAAPAALPTPAAGEVQGVLPNMQAQPTAVGRRDMASKLQLLKAKGPRDRWQRQKVQAQVDAEQPSSAAPHAYNPHRAVLQNMAGAFHTVLPPTAPSVPPPYKTNKGGLFGGRLLQPEEFPGTKVNQQPQRASPSPFVPTKLHVAGNHGGEQNAKAASGQGRAAVGGMTYESEPAAPTCQHQEVAARWAVRQRQAAALSRLAQAARQRRGLGAAVPAG